MLKRKLVQGGLILVVAFMLGTGGGGIVADMFGFDVVSTVQARNDGCDAGGGC